MEMALYEPGLGYYSAGASKLGAGGDFITAPEVSSLFSRCLATQCGEILQHVSGGAILEFGAGSGVMAADLLNELAAQGALPERYLILEVSADLRERQQALVRERAPAHAARIEWLDRLPEEFRGVVLANEVLDALPVQRFRIRGDQVNSAGCHLAARPARLVRGPRGCGARSSRAAHRGEHRRAIAGRLHVGDQSAAGAVDRRCRIGTSRRRGAVHRLWLAAASVLSQRAARGHVAVPLPASLPRRSSDQRRCAGYRRVGGLHRSRGGGVRRRTDGRGLRDAGAFLDRQRTGAVAGAGRGLRARFARAARTSGDAADVARRNGRAIQGDRIEPRLRAAAARFQLSGI